jgi:hypothetical protein
MNLSSERAPLTGCIVFYGAAYLPRLRAMPRHRVQAIAEQASEQSDHGPLHQTPEPIFQVSAWDPDNRLTGGQVITLLVLSLWVLCGENEQVAAPVMEAWPIREILLLCNSSSERT